VIRDNSKLAFFIHIRLANNANGHIHRICIRHLIFNWCQFASDFFYEKDANHHESRIVWPYPYKNLQIFVYVPLKQNLMSN